MKSRKVLFSEAIESILRYTGVKISKRQAEILLKKAVQDFDEYYEQKCGPLQLEQAKNLPLLVLTTDSKGIVVRKQDLREETRKKASHCQNKLNRRMSKFDTKNRKRMATVASVYQIESFVRPPELVIRELAPKTHRKTIKRPRPQAKRVRASLEKMPKQLLNEMFEEAFKRDPQRTKKWVCLIDGEPNQLKRLKSLISMTEVNVVIILNIIHVIEYLWKAVRVFYEEGNKANGTYLGHFIV